MPQSTHRLVGVAEISIAWDFEAAAPELDQPSLRLALVDDAAFESSLPELTLAADLSSLSAELDREYRQFVGSGMGSELVVL